MLSSRAVVRVASCAVISCGLAARLSAIVVQRVSRVRAVASAFSLACRAQWKCSSASFSVTKLTTWAWMWAPSHWSRCVSWLPGMTRGTPPRCCGPTSCTGSGLSRTGASSPTAPLFGLSPTCGHTPPSWGRHRGPGRPRSEAAVRAARAPATGALMCRGLGCCLGFEVACF